MVDTHVETKTYFDPAYFKSVRFSFSLKRQNNLPATILGLMLGTLVFALAVLNLRDLGFGDGLVGHLIPLTAWPAHVLFSDLPLTIVPYFHTRATLLGWQETGLLAGTFLSIFLLYLIALRCLPSRISFRYIVISTLVIGAFYILIPILTSSDIFSYISYARYGVFYHQNMLTVTPMMFPNDVITTFVQWRGQPSAYGPSWAFLSYTLQWALGLFNPTNITNMVLALRVLGLVMQVLSSWLVWTIIGRLQERSGYRAPQRRLMATLAFAWNPLLLFEACVNAHNDSSLLFLVLLAILMLVPKGRTTPLNYVLCAFFLALATCLKINIVLLFPGLLLFLWVQRHRRIDVILAVVLTYVSTIVLLYAPFWSNGAVLQVFSVNPGTVRAVNTPADFLSHLYNGLIAAFGAPVQLPIGSPSEHVLHNIFTDCFVLVCIVYGLKTLLMPRMINTLPRMLQWMALMWLLYCVLTPWFWPWYMFVFFGLYALLEGVSDDKRGLRGFFQPSWMPRLLTLTMLCLNCFTTSAMTQSTIPGLPGFQWTFLRGLWAWLPLLIYCWQLRPRLKRPALTPSLEQKTPVLLPLLEESRSKVTV